MISKFIGGGRDKDNSSVVKHLSFLCTGLLIRNLKSRNIFCLSYRSRMLSKINLTSEIANLRILIGKKL